MQHPKMDFERLLSLVGKPDAVTRISLEEAEEAADAHEEWQARRWSELAAAIARKDQVLKEARKRTFARQLLRAAQELNQDNPSL